LFAGHFRPLRQYIKVGSPGNTADSSEDTQLQLPLIAGVLRTHLVEEFDVMLVFTYPVQNSPVFCIVQSVRPGPRTGLHKIHAVRPISGLD